MATRLHRCTGAEDDPNRARRGSRTPVRCGGPAPTPVPAALGLVARVCVPPGEHRTIGQSSAGVRIGLGDGISHAGPSARMSVLARYRYAYAGWYAALAWPPHEGELARLIAGWPQLAESTRYGKQVVGRWVMPPRPATSQGPWSIRRQNWLLEGARRMAVEGKVILSLRGDRSEEVTDISLTVQRTTMIPGQQNWRV